ncbi:HNH endonuclease, partial [Pseudarthrobacter sp. R1]|uniref:HNH endonuclease signature motif containing protein n=1 Tax=Pseudarthrobacter sp. R1 TaxID=2944934 RepID=UPI00210E4D7D
LDGSGPIPASMARNLVGDGAGSFYRVLVDPRDGAPLEIGRTRYRLTKAMRNWLRLRDGKCPFPGCSNNALDNEADHLLAWHKGGTTGISNLGQPCPKHHKLRHISGWKPTPATTTEPPGWTSPTGRHYKSEHQDWEPPLWPTEVGVSLPRAVAAADLAELQTAALISAGFQAAELRAEDSALTYDPWVDIAPEDFITSDDLSPEEPRWEDLHDVPEVLPHDPFPDWELFLTSESVLHV